MRPFLLALLVPVALAAVAGCADPDPAPPPADPEALRLLEAVDASAVAEAFDALQARAYEADLTVTTLGDAGEASSPETFTVDHAGGTVPEDAGDDAGPRLRDPIASALPEDPPYVDPVAREAYRLGVVGDTTIGGADFRLVEARLTNPAAESTIELVRAAVTDDGRVGAIDVRRRADAAIYTEASRVRVDLAPVGGTWLPRRIRTDTQTDVPLAEPSHVRTEWTIRPATAGASGA